ncbi:MAG: DJ-1/PfpI family protein [Campylobacteraceae bacterium]|jgi:transcriptional regulator GlxA family with amidase domain|nr:DJ-1/PfpI family protein [Campylobacteraceae bacterium]
MDINCLLFDDFETMDLFGPVEVFGKIEEYQIKYFSIEGKVVTSRQNARILTENINDMTSNSIMVIPGGKGTRDLVNNSGFIQKLKDAAEKSSWCLSICTGSALLAKAGLIDGLEATSNKIAFEWVRTNGKHVKWVYKARWATDGKYYTSSGVSAGIDMSLGFVADRFGEKRAQDIAKMIEYQWNCDKHDDIFAL